MACVPDQAIFRKVERQMQRNAKFDHTEIAGKMRGTVRYDLEQRFTNLIGQVHKIAVAEPIQILRGSDAA